MESYLSYQKDGTFKHLIVFGAGRKPIYMIDYGMHNHEKSLHVHYYVDGERSKSPTIIRPGNSLYEKYKHLFKGVKP